MLPGSSQRRPALSAFLQLCVVYLTETRLRRLIAAQDFYCDEHADIGSAYLRLAFCKDVDTLDEAGKRLLKLKPYIRDA